MKKTLLALLLALCLFSMLPSAFAEDLSHVSDAAGILSPEQAAAIEEKLDALYADYGMDAIVATTNDSEGKEVQLYAADFYDAFRDYDAYPNGVALVFCFDIGKYYEISRGTAEDIFASNDGLYDALQDALSRKDYASALSDWTDYVVDTIVPDPAYHVALRYSWIALALGLLTAFIVTGVMKSKIKTARKQSDADSYIRENSLNLRRDADIFLYETETRSKIEKNDNNSGHSESVTSSSGNSYSGHGGDL